MTTGFDNLEMDEKERVLAARMAFHAAIDMAIAAGTAYAGRPGMTSTVLTIALKELRPRLPEGSERERIVLALTRGFVLKEGLERLRTGMGADANLVVDFGTASTSKGVE